MKKILKKIIKWILCRLFKIILYFKNNKNTPKKYTVSVCAIFKNESKSLKEWIEYHKIIGVDHFYLYNNFSNDDFLEVLKPYLIDETVSLIDWPIECGQVQAYKDCVEKFSSQSNWIAFIDIDEFIVPIKDNSIKNYLKKFEKYPSVLLNWKTFGSSGKLSRKKNSLVIEDFVVCEPSYYFGKSIYNTSFKFNPLSKYADTTLVHVFYGKVGLFYIPPVTSNEKFYFGQTDKLDKVNSLPIQLNHYYTKSYEEYKEKINRGDAVFKESNHYLDNFFNVERQCCEVDYSIYKFLIELKQKMNIEE